MTDIQSVNIEALSIVAHIQGIKSINSPDDYAKAAEFYKSGKSMMAQIDNAYDSIIAAAHKAHKEAVAKKKSFYEPVESAVKQVWRLMSAYDSAQEKIRLDEQRRLEELARQKEAERKLAEAIAVEASGDTETADAILNEPVTIAPVIIPRAVPKIEGVRSFREVWKFRIINAGLIPRQYLIPDENVIGGVVRSLKGAASIPGIEVYSEKI